MAKQEQLALLKRGATEWNEWREKNPYLRPDLSDADLRGARLSGFHLYRADLSRANLSGASLRGANLSGANLSRAHLSRVDLSGALLRGADLSFANLGRADLRGADLCKANLSQADLMEATLTAAYLCEANFSGTNLSGTVLGGIDLREVRGLETVHHRRPSYISVDTIYRSEGQISEGFLRGAGVPDTFIEYMRSLVIKPIDYATCCISYSSKDEAFAQRLSADLQHERLSCWFAPEQMKSADKRRQRMDEPIRYYDKLLLVLSAHSIASPWVQHEVEAALEKEEQRGGQVLFPIALDDTVQHAAQAWAATIRRRKQIGDFSRWENDKAYQQALERLLRDVKVEA